MANEEKAKSAKYKVTSSFVWDRKIQKPNDEVTLTDGQAASLLQRGKIEKIEAKRGRGKATDTGQD